jgi:hypothetical protein
MSDNDPGSYLSGTRNQLNTAPVSGDASVSAGHAPPGYVRKQRPGSVSIMSINPQETLPYGSGISPNYAATYIGAAGVSSRTPSVLASSVYARVGSQSIANLQSGEILVLHQWGKLVNGFQPENDIVIGRNWTKAGYVDFTIYISAYGNPWVRTITCPASHTYSIYIKAVNPIGTRYSRLEFCVYDASALKSYVYQLALPASQTMDGADVALEKYYADNEPRPGKLLQWRTVSAFHVLDQNRHYVNLAQSGFVLEWLTSGVQTAYYHDYKYYSGVRNGDGTFYLTRYSTGGSYPPHP